MFSMKIHGGRRARQWVAADAQIQGTGRGPGHVRRLKPRMTNHLVVHNVVDETNVADVAIGEGAGICQLRRDWDSFYKGCVKTGCDWAADVPFSQPRTADASP
ncbi:MAG: hypothetical protein RLZZ232_2819 [Planctomycetota bacterium]|jgi:hypothetical protein